MFVDADYNRKQRASIQCKKNLYSTFLVALVLITVPASVQAREKPVLVIGALKSNQLPASTLKIVIDHLASAFIRTEKYTVITDGLYARHIEEKSISLLENRGNVSPVEAGLLLSAHFQVTGDLTFLDDTYILKLEMLEAATGRILTQIENRYATRDLLLDDAYVLARKLAGSPIYDHLKDNVVKRRKRDHLPGKYSSLSLIFHNPIFPLGDGLRVVSYVGMAPGLSYHYNFPLPWGIVGLGFISSFHLYMYASVKVGSTICYSFAFSFPETLSIRYMTNSMYPYFLAFELNGGCEISIAYFSCDDSLTHEQISSDKEQRILPFFSFGQSLGYYFNPYFGLALYNTFQLSSYADRYQWSIVPGLRCEVNF